MPNRKIVIDAPANKLEELQQKLSTDPTLIDALAANPKETLAAYGITIDDETADSIKNHFSNLAGAGPGASPITIAIGIAIAAAVAVP